MAMLCWVVGQDGMDSHDVSLRYLGGFECNSAITVTLYNYFSFAIILSSQIAFM